MTLRELNTKCYISPGEWEPVTTYVFNNEDSADNWINDIYNGRKNEDSELLCVMKSAFMDDIYMKKEILDAEVLHFFAVERDVIVAVIDYGRRNSKNG